MGDNLASVAPQLTVSQSFVDEKMLKKNFKVKNVEFVV
jgi:hypothetical protein